jgi:capsular exopolysaccharide synthesis family protein
MSKIHHAIRRLERQKSPDDSHGLPAHRGFLEDIQKYLTPLSEHDLTDRELRPRQERQLIVGSDKAARVDLRKCTNSGLVALLAPRSQPSEQYRALKTKIFQMQQGKELRSLLITSAGTSDGKSLTAINLALTMAHEIDCKVLLVEADLRRPSFQDYLGLPKLLGLSDYLLGSCSLDEVIHGTDLKDFCLVPAGAIPENPLELLNSGRMQSFLLQVSGKFDLAIVDSPPVLAVADADLLAAKVDGVVFVVRPGHTQADMLAKSMECLKGKRLLGTVLNSYEDEELRKRSYYYDYHGKELG